MASVKKFDICVARPKGNNEVWWHRIGRASENERGQISLFFDSLPYPDNQGRCQAMLFEQRDRDDQQRSSFNSRPRAGSGGDDDIPF